MDLHTSTTHKAGCSMFNVEAVQSSAIDIYVSDLSISSETAYIGCYDEILFLTREYVTVFTLLLNREIPHISWL